MASALWLTILPTLLLSAYFVRKWYLARRLRLHGIGKGAPGFQTSVRQIRVTPEIAARLRRGEQVSPEEIAQASARADQEEFQKASGTAVDDKRAAVEKDSGDSEPNEWLPDTITGPRKRGKGRKK